MYCALVLIKYTNVPGENVTVTPKEVTNIIDGTNKGKATAYEQYTLLRRYDTICTARKTNEYLQGLTYQGTKDNVNC